MAYNVVIYVAIAHLFAINAAAQETQTTEGPPLDPGPRSTEGPPLDPGPRSFQSIVPEAQLTLPRPGQLRPRTKADLESLEAILSSLPAQPVQIRKKFSNANPSSSAISKSARTKEWGRMFGFDGTVFMLLQRILKICHNWYRIQFALLLSIHGHGAGWGAPPFP
jgi:hypothetical protein